MRDPATNTPRAIIVTLGVTMVSYVSVSATAASLLERPVCTPDKPGLGNTVEADCAR